MYTTEQALEGYADLIQPDLLDEVQRECTALRELLDMRTEDFETLRTAYSTLEGAAFRIAESMYDE